MVFFAIFHYNNSFCFCKKSFFNFVVKLEKTCSKKGGFSSVMLKLFQNGTNKSLYICKILSFPPFVEDSGSANLGKCNQISSEAVSCQLSASSCQLPPCPIFSSSEDKSSPWSNFFYKVFWKNQLLNRTILSRRFRLLNFRHYNTVWSGSKSKKIADELSFPQMINWPYDLLSRMISWFAINRPVDNRIILGDAHHDHLAKMIRWPE